MKNVRSLVHEYLDSVGLSYEISESGDFCFPIPIDEPLSFENTDMIIASTFNRIYADDNSIIAYSYPIIRTNDGDKFLMVDDDNSYDALAYLTNLNWLKNGGCQFQVSDSVRCVYDYMFYSDAVMPSLQTIGIIIGKPRWQWDFFGVGLTSVMFSGTSPQYAAIKAYENYLEYEANVGK